MSIKVNTKLFSGASLEDESLKHISHSPIKQLDLSGCSEITAKGLQYLSKLPIGTKELLRSDGCLDLSNMKITDEDLARIIKKYKDKNRNIISINLSNCPNITDEGLKHLSNLPLKQLNLSNGSNFTDKGLKHLSNLPLEQLNLFHCSNFTDEGLKHLSNLPLKQLNLSYCSNFTDEGLKHLSNLSLKQLEQLDLSSCSKITDKGLEHLSNLPLKWLNLSDCFNITDKGLEYLSNLPLKWLNLRHCFKITDKGLEHLSNLPLEQLDLRSCSKITDGDNMMKVLPILNYFRRSDFLQLGTDASKVADYSRLYKLVGQYTI